MTFTPLDIDIYAEVVPYVRMTQRGKWVKPDAIRYMNSQREVKILMSYAKHNRDDYEDWIVPEKCQFSVVVAFYVKQAHRCDLDNLCKAILDAGQGVLYKDDRYADKITAIRIKTESEPHVRLIITPMEEKK